MSIKLDVKKYCDDCPFFEADVSKYDFITEHRTMIRCTREQICSTLYFYIAQRMVTVDDLVDMHTTVIDVNGECVWDSDFELPEVPLKEFLDGRPAAVEIHLAEED